MKKPELLLPAGNTETFVAAIEGGADAVYLGLKEFNARGRATNFTIFQLRNVVDFAHKKGKKVYLTLNTVIKNTELSKLADTLFQVSQIDVDAVIIQDLGVYFVIKNFFDNINVHASTQAGIHNSAGVNYFAKHNFERVILARELTIRELQTISKKAKIPIEIFIHGALCYSLSGMCLFSSFLGGQSANRGLCRQPCRRIYKSDKGESYLFNLKDNEQIDNIPILKRLNISSLKVEGRMKSAEYIYKVAKAYRMVLDDDSKLDEAKELLKEDFGREKTAYFMGKNLINAISENPYTGIYLGNVISVFKDKVTFVSKMELKEGYRIRFLDKEGRDSEALKIKEFTQENNRYTLTIKNTVEKGNKVFLVGKNDVRFSKKLPEIKGKIKFQYPKKGRIYKKIKISYKNPNKELLYIRIDNPAWMRKLDFKKFDFLILNFTKSDFTNFDFSVNILQKNMDKIILQFPKFISEESLEYYKKLAKGFYEYGYTKFMLSHISQIRLLKSLKNISIFSSENVYVFNDAAAKFLQENGVKKFVYPFENEYPNLIAMQNKNGVVPLFFKPSLFNSRMPVNAMKKEFKDNKFEYEKFIKNGITITVPKIPVALFQYKRKLKGFSEFLIDLSFFEPSKGLIKKVFDKYEKKEAFQPSKTFNFKKGLG